MDFDPRLTELGVRVEPSSDAVWKVVSAKYQDETESGGNHHIYFTVLDVNGKPVGGIPCVVDWAGRDPEDKPTVTLSDANGQANFPMYANLDPALKNGPYFAFIEYPGKSDVVGWMGLPEHHHVNYLLTFAATRSHEPETLEQAAQAAAQKHTWMPINTDAALYKFALMNDLGCPQTDEFEFTFGADTYVAQVYDLGIVYVKKGDWGKVRWVSKP
jgi:hypothetical protein